MTVRQVLASKRVTPQIYFAETRSSCIVTLSGPPRSRAILTSFMQAQLRALWVDEPKMSADLEDSDALPAALPAIPAQTSR